LEELVSLATGIRLGIYEVLGPLGEGGMGEVYRARDTRLDRDVALKILPPSFARDPDRLRRFEREAKALATLNHPHIAQIHGIEDSAVGPALAMELVEGEDLAQRIARGPLPVDEALAIARQLADALEAAHDAGIVHRDLKPANVRVRPDSTVKVLDFGLARLHSEHLPEGALDPVNSPTLTVQGTAVGVILGTAAYMAPEQARGRLVDRRADIWAFGCVLYELLTGRRIFQGETVTDVLAAVMTRDPEWAALPPAVPPAVRRLLERCLTRDPRRRLRDIGEARVALEDDTVATAPPGPARAPVPFLVWLAATLVIAAVTGLATWVLRTPGEPPLRRFMIPMPDDAPPVHAAIAPRGDAVAFVTAERAWIQRLDEFAPAEVPSSTGATVVFWSPDAAFLGFQARDHLWKVDLRGGAPSVIGRVPSNFNPMSAGASWLDDGRIVFTTGMTTGLLEIPAEGGEARPLLDVNAETERDFHNVSALPGNRGFLFTTHARDRAGYDVELYVPTDGTRRVVRGASPANTPVYSPTGHLLFERDGSVWMQPFSLDRLAPTGDPSLVAAGARQPAIARDGTLVMLPDAGGDTRLAVLDRTGELQATFGEADLRLSHPRISPDGRLAAATVGPVPASDIWIFDLARGTHRRLTFEPGRHQYPLWMPDGQHVLYVCDTSICARRADGSGERVELLDGVLPWSRPALSPDGRKLVVLRDHGARSALWVVDLDPGSATIPGGAAPKLLLASQGVLGGADVSPDGRFIAYTAQETGRTAVYVSRFPSGEGRWEVSGGQGRWPRWGADGDRLYFNDALHRIVEVEVTLGQTFRVGPVLSRVPARGSTGLGFDVTADGTQFLVARSEGGHTRTSSLLVVQNWKGR
jgi:eukaryotic-like serine/threonine-protein kinase